MDRSSPQMVAVSTVFFREDKELDSEETRNRPEHGGEVREGSGSPSYRITKPQAKQSFAGMKPYIAAGP